MNLKRWAAMMVLLLCLAMACAGAAEDPVSPVPQDAAAAPVETGVTFRCGQEVISPETGLILPKDVQNGKDITVEYDRNAFKGTPQWSSSDEKAVKPLQAREPNTYRILPSNTGTSTITCTLTRTNGEKLELTFPVTVYLRASSMTINKKNSYTHDPIWKDNTTKSLNELVEVKPEAAGYRTPVWSSSNGDVAEVDGQGVVTGKSGGTVTLTGVLPEPGVEKPLTVTVTLTVQERVTGVKLPEEEVRVPLNGRSAIRVNILPASATDKTLAWSSSNEAVAKVDKDGRVEGLAEGTCTITARAADGSGAEDSCQVRVITPVSGINFPTALSFFAGDTHQLKAEIWPANASIPELAWGSGNEEIATVDEAGNITALAPGSTAITAAATDGSGVTGTYQLTVEPAIPVEITAMAVHRTYGEDSNCLVITPRNVCAKKRITSFRFQVDCLDSRGELLCSYLCEWTGDALDPGTEASAAVCYWPDMFYCVYAQQLSFTVTDVSFDDGTDREIPEADRRSADF